MTQALSYATPGVGIGPRCLLIGTPITAALWAIIFATIAPAPAAPILSMPVKDARQ